MFSDRVNKIATFAKSCLFWDFFFGIISLSYIDSCPIPLTVFIKVFLERLLWFLMILINFFKRLGKKSG